MVKIRYILLLIFASTVLIAQPHTFVRSALSKNQTFVKEPVMLRITVLTKTWFTTAPNLDNIVIEDALTIRKDRAQSGFEIIDGTRYTLLYFDFYVFPLSDGQIEIPAITMSYSTPKEGDFKGTEFSLSSKAKSFTANKIEIENYNGDFASATSLTLAVKFNLELNDLKVGDVLDREISFNASGTIAALLPEANIPELELAKVYSSPPQMNNENNQGVLSSSRKDIQKILLEKPGELIIPEQLYYWYNYSTKKINTIKTRSRIITIAENPDLAILQTIQDSLENRNNSESVDESIPLGKILIAAALLIIVIAILYRMFKKITERYKVYVTNKQNAYHESHSYFIDQLKELQKNDEQEKFYFMLLRMFNRFVDMRNFTLSEYLIKIKENELAALLTNLENHLYNDQKGDLNLNRIIELAGRINFSISKDQTKSTLSLRLNP